MVIIIFFLRLWDYFRKTKFYEEYVKWWNCNDFLNMILLDLPLGELKQYFMGLLPSWNLFQLWLENRLMHDICRIKWRSWNFFFKKTLPCIYLIKGHIYVYKQVSKTKGKHVRFYLLTFFKMPTALMLYEDF